MTNGERGGRRRAGERKSGRTVERWEKSLRWLLERFVAGRGGERVPEEAVDAVGIEVDGAVAARCVDAARVMAAGGDCLLPSWFQLLARGTIERGRSATTRR